MPTDVIRLSENIIEVRWVHPLTARELDVCFTELQKMLSSTQDTKHVLFDLRSAGSIPSQAPRLAIRSRFLNSESIGKVVVVSTDLIAQVLASVASGITRRDIEFSSDYEAALDSLRDGQTNERDVSYIKKGAAGSAPANLFPDDVE